MTPDVCGLPDTVMAFTSDNDHAQNSKDFAKAVTLSHDLASSHEDVMVPIPVHVPTSENIIMTPTPDHDLSPNSKIS